MLLKNTIAIETKTRVKNKIRSAEKNTTEARFVSFQEFFNLNKI